MAPLEMAVPMANLQVRLVPTRPMPQLRKPLLERSVALQLLLLMLPRNERRSNNKLRVLIRMVMSRRSKDGWDSISIGTGIGIEGLSGYKAGIENVV